MQHAWETDPKPAGWFSGWHWHWPAAVAWLPRELLPWHKPGFFWHIAVVCQKQAQTSHTCVWCSGFCLVPNHAFLLIGPNAVLRLYCALKRACTTGQTCTSALSDVRQRFSGITSPAAVHLALPDCMQAGGAQQATGQGDAGPVRGKVHRELHGWATSAISGSQCSCPAWPLLSAGAPATASL